MNIRLSPKHGINPSIPVCFFCGREKNEIALLGRLKGDAEAPRNIIIDTEPCDQCKADMARGYTLLGIQDHPVIENQPSITSTGKYYLSGGFVVLSEQGVRNILKPETAEKLLSSEQHITYADDSIIQALNQAAKEQQADEQDKTDD